MRKLLAVLATAALLLTGCARPTKIVTFAAAAKPNGSSVIMVIDIVGTPGSGSLFKSYPREIVVQTPAVEVVEIEVGAVTHMSVKVFSTEPGQTVSCKILINAVPVEAGAPFTKRQATCIGPPV